MARYSFRNARRAALAIAVGGCVGLLLFAANAPAAPISTSFLNVDINGGTGPTQPDGTPAWQAFNVPADNAFVWGASGTTLSNVYATGVGNVTVELTGIGASLNSRNRNNPPWENDTTTGHEPLARMYRDFAYATRDSNIGFGRNFVQVHLEGLTAGQQYEITAFSYDQNSANNDSYMAWGIQNPAAWLDANVGAGANYQPAVGGVNNPIPTLARNHSTGSWPSSKGGFEAGTYYYSSSFLVTANGTGELDFYGWADPETYTGTQTISMINGFQIGAVPEPTALLLVGMGLFGLAAARRRS
jgi:hypothetical protein